MADYDIRALEIHSYYAWDFDWIEKCMDFMEQEGFNALVLHRNDFIDLIIYPGKYFGCSENKKYRNIFERYADCFRSLYKYTPTRRSSPYQRRAFLKRVIERAKYKGFKIFIENKELYFPDIILEFFPNLAAKDGNTISWSLEEITRDSDLALEIGASILVLHPGYLLPSSVPSSSEKRIALLRGKDLEPYIADPGSSICTWDYPESRLYRSAFERMWKNLHSISSRLEEKGIILAAENLNPRAGYMLILPDEMLELARLEHIHFCLDIGHMWITSILFHFDYLKAVRDILDTGKVITSHIHSNPSRPGLYRDTHESVYKYGLPYKEVLGMLNEAGCNMMLETVEEPEKNLEILFN